MVIIDTLVNTLFGGLTLDPAGMHCPSWDDAFVSSFLCCESVNHLVDVKLILIHLQVVLTWLQQPTSLLLNIACSNVKL